MSWNVIIMSVRGSPFDPLGEDPDLEAPLGEAADVRQRIVDAMPGVRWVDEGTGEYREGELAFELNVQAQGRVDSFMVHVEGHGDPLPTVSALCRGNGWVAFDSTAGEYLDPDDPSDFGWMGYEAQRDDKVIPPHQD